MTPKASMSSSRYPAYGIASLFAAVNLNQLPVGKTGFPWGQKWSLKNSPVIGDTSDPESKRQGMSTPPNHTVTTGHFPTAFLYTVDISIFEPLLSPPVTWLLMTWGVSTLENPNCSCFRGTVKNRSFRSSMSVSPTSSAIFPTPSPLPSAWHGMVHPRFAELLLSISLNAKL